MGPEKNLAQLLKSLNPHLQAKRFVFCSISQQTFDQLLIEPLCTFREEEGITIIIDVEEADQWALPYASTWALITCGVHSDLTAVGLLAALAGKLATAGIGVNVVSAYYHDHLFVPAGEAECALALLRQASIAESGDS